MHPRPFSRPDSSERQPSFVDAQGNTRDVRVPKPLGMGLDEKSVEAVRTWRFRPGQKNNLPVAVSMLVEITFRLF